MPMCSCVWVMGAMLGCASHHSPSATGPGAKPRQFDLCRKHCRAPGGRAAAPGTHASSSAPSFLCQPQSCPRSRRPHPGLAGGCRATRAVPVPVSVITAQPTLVVAGTAHCGTNSSNGLRHLTELLQVSNQLLVAESCPGASQKMGFFPLKIRQWDTWSLPRSKRISHHCGGRRKSELGFPGL